MSAASTRLPFALTRTTLRRVATGLAGVLLCVQMAIAAYACPAFVSVTADAPGAAAASAVSTPMSNCGGMNGAIGIALDPDAPNLCAEHCKYGQQSDQAGTLGLPAAVMTALYAVQPVPVVAPPARLAAAALSALVAASPPYAIAHCVYRI